MVIVPPIEGYRFYRNARRLERVKILHGRLTRIVYVNVGVYCSCCNELLFLCVGVYDQDAPEELLLAQPNLYGKGRLGWVYQSHSFWLAIIDAVYQSLVIFYFALWVSAGRI